MKATLTSRGQVTIPVKIRRKLNLHAGEVLEFDEQAPYVRAMPAFDEAEMRSVLGCCRKRRLPVNVKKWLDQTRGPVELPSERNDHRR